LISLWIFSKYFRMQKVKIFFSLFCFCIFFSCYENKKITVSNYSRDSNIEVEIDDYLEKVTRENDIPGMALGVVKNGKLIYEKYKGAASLETGEKVDSNSIFRIYSTTKLLTVVSIFKLIEEEKIKLEEPVTKYIHSLPREWSHIKIHNIITHSSGLPDMMNLDIGLSDDEILKQLYKKPIEFKAGEKFAYNQTNYWFLTKIIEEVTNLTYEEFVLAHQFENRKNSIVFSSDHSDRIERKADLYWYQADKKAYERVNVDFGNRANSATGLIISLQEFLNWNERFDSNKLIKPSTKEMMWKPYEYSNDEDSFLHGWGVYENSVGFTGSGVTGLRKFLDDDLTIIFLSNGFKDQPVHNEIIDKVASIILNK